MTELNITFNEIAYIGDDVNDIEILERVKFSACPSDGVQECKEIVDYICKNKGGEGCVREFVNKYFLSKDAREFRKYYSSLSPDLDLKVQVETLSGVQEDTDLPIGVSFFWPDSEL